MVIQVTYQSKKDADDPYSGFTRSEFFESETMPDKATIIRKLSAMCRDFVAKSIAIAEYKGDPEKMRKAGLRVTKI